MIDDWKTINDKDRSCVPSKTIVVRVTTKLDKFDIKIQTIANALMVYNFVANELQFYNKLK